MRIKTRRSIRAVLGRKTRPGSFAAAAAASGNVPFAEQPAVQQRQSRVGRPSEADGQRVVDEHLAVPVSGQHAADAAVRQTRARVHDDSHAAPGQPRVLRHDFRQQRLDQSHVFVAQHQPRVRLQQLQRIRRFIVTSLRDTTTRGGGLPVFDVSTPTIS